MLKVILWTLYDPRKDPVHTSRTFSEFFKATWGTGRSIVLEKKKLIRRPTKMVWKTFVSVSPPHLADQVFQINQVLLGLANLVRGPKNLAPSTFVLLRRPKLGLRSVSVSDLPKILVHGPKKLDPEPFAPVMLPTLSRAPFRSKSLLLIRKLWQPSFLGPKPQSEKLFHGV